MNGLRIGVTFVIVFGIFLLSVFQMQLRGYEKIGRIEEWTVYYSGEEECESTVPFYSDSSYQYYYMCADSESFMVKSGFEEHTIEYAFDNNLITIGDLEEVIDVSKIEID